MKSPFVSCSILTLFVIFGFTFGDIFNDAFGESDDYTVCGKRLTDDQDTDFIFKDTASSDSQNPPGSWPWVVSIGRNSTDHIWIHRCGGSLISPEVVLTAGHCALGLATKIKQGEIFIRAGDDNLQDASDDKSVEEVDVVDYSVHPNYKRGTRYSDIAVLRLSRPVTLSSTIRTICLPSEVTAREEDDHFSLTVTGWGADEEDQSGKSLFHARVQVYPQASCDATHRGERKSQQAVPEGFTDELLCGGDSAQGEGVCKGDSGSPAVFHDIVKRNYVLKAVVSGGISCGTQEHPNIYVRTSDSNILGWIYQEMNKELLINITQSLLEDGTILETKGGCNGEDTCKSRETCPYIQKKYDEAIAERKLGRKSKKYKEMINYLKSQVCNKKRMQFCCPKSENIYVVGRSPVRGDESCIPEAYNPSLNSWSSLPPLLTPREFFGLSSAVTVFNNELYVIGGLKEPLQLEPIILNTAEKWNPVSKQWTSIANFNSGRIDAEAVVVADKLFLVGGVGSRFDPILSVEMYDNNQWKRIIVVPEAYKGYFYGRRFVQLNEKLYGVGGLNTSDIFFVIDSSGPDSSGPDSSSVLSFDALSWLKHKDNATCKDCPSPWIGETHMKKAREFPGVATLDGKIYAAGGNDDKVTLNSVEMFDPVTNEWTYVANMTVARSRPALVSQGGKLWAFGGYGDFINREEIVDLSSFEMYDPVIDKWTIVGDMKSCKGEVKAVVLCQEP